MTINARAMHSAEAVASISGMADAGLWDQVIDEVHGRRIRIGDRWLVDFASCNYLGFDLEPEIIEAIGVQLRRWGTHPSWSRMLGSPRLNPEIEEQLAELLGAPDALTLPTISQIHLSVIPVLAGDGVIFLESRAHRTIYDGCVHARALGARVQRFRADEPEHLVELLRTAPAGGTRLVCMDGVNSMTGNAADITQIAGICREHGATLYIDDAHGFGVIGERHPAEVSPYGRRGNAVVRHHDERYAGIVLVGGFSKAYSSMLAFVACEPDIKRKLKVTAPPYLFSGPTATAALASVLAGFAVNLARGEAIREKLYRLTRRVLDHLAGLGLHTTNVSGFPLIHLSLTRPGDLHDVGRALLARGCYVTLTPYPGVPRDEVGIRIQLTAAHRDDEVDELLATLTWLAAAERDGVPLLRRDG